MAYRPFHQKRIAIAGSRRFKEIASIVSKLGGIALERPMMRSASNQTNDISNAIRTLSKQETDWMILLTGVGTKALFKKASELGEDLPSILEKACIAARGYKTLKVLKELNLNANVQDDDGTIAGLKRKLESFDFSGKRVTLQLHGERVPELSDWLTSQGASVLEIPLYFYDPPELKDSQRLLYEALSGELDAIAFTSSTQVKFFFQAAKNLNALAYLKNAFNAHLIALSVGSVTSQALRAQGVSRIIAPSHERMGAMVIALADYFETQTKPGKDLTSKHVKTKKTSFPVLLTNLKNVIVIGGGSVAERKIKKLIDANTKPTVISPKLTKSLKELRDKGKIQHKNRSYHPADLTGADLVIAATQDTNINQNVVKEARARAILHNSVDTPELSSFTSLGALRRGDLCVCVSTNGKSPSFNRYLIEKLANQLPESYASLLSLFEDHRESLKTLSKEQRDSLFERCMHTETANLLIQNPEHLKQMIHAAKLKAA